MSASPDAHDASDASHGARTRTSAFCVIALLGLAGVLAASLFAHPPDDHGAHDPAPTLWLLGTLPFLAVLGAIAVFPLVPALSHWWHSNLSRLFVSVLASLATQSEQAPVHAKLLLRQANHVYRELFAEPEDDPSAYHNCLKETMRPFVNQLDTQLGLELPEEFTQFFKVEADEE